MSNTIYQLRQAELDPALAAKLFPFTNAYRPHDPAPTWQELKAQGLEKVDEDSLMDIIIDQYEYEKECYES
jgi:hypothetical protein